MTTQATPLDPEHEAREHFLRNIEQMNVNSTLFRRLPDGKIEAVFVSKAFAQMMECTVDEAFEMMNGMGLYKSTVPQDRPLVRSMLRRRVAYDGTSSITIQKITAKHNRIWCNVSYAFIDDFSEHYIYCTYTDVTTLKLHEERLRSTYSNLGNSYYRVGAATLGMFRVNLSKDQFEEVKGKDLFDSDSIVYSYSDSMRERMKHFPIESERAQFLQLFDKDSLTNRYIAGEMRTKLVLYSIRKDGRSCFVRLSASVTRHPLSGDVIAFITEQECNDKKVSEMLTNRILAQQFDMVAYLVDGRYGVTISGASHSKIDSIHPTTSEGDYQTYLESQVAPVLSGTDAEKREVLDALNLATVEKEVDVSKSYVVDFAIEEDGKVLYKRFDFYSINPEARFYILLESDTTAVQEKQIALNEQLKDALEGANQANLAKTAFLSSVSHEIRTPMNAIIGLNRMALADENLSERTRRQLEKIDASAHHLLNLVSDVLDMSRIESGRMVLESTEFSLAELLDHVNTIIAFQCQERDLHYTFEVEAGCDDLFIGDVAKLEQVIVNILGNAVKFTPAGGSVSLGVKRTAALDDQTGLRFTISDTGIGMSEEFIPRVFDAFSQEDENQANKYGSTGLGLALAKNTIDLMNGEISVESTKGVGTTFTIDLTLQNATSHKAEAEAETQDDDFEALAGCKVLIAEDIDLNAEILTELLGLFDVEADRAENGQIAVRMFADSAEGAYDAVLMDLRMPVMDGYEASRAIREMERADAKDVPIIAVTANALAEDVQRCLQAGMDAHVAKPVEPDLLLATLARHVSR